MLLYYEVLVVWWIQFRLVLYDFFILSLQKMADYPVGCILVIITNGVLRGFYVTFFRH